MSGRKRLLKLLSGDVAHTVGAGLPRLDQPFEGAEGLFERRSRIEFMRQVQLDAFHAEPLEARLDLPENPVTGEAGILPAVHSVEGLGRDPRPVPTLPHPAPDRRLAAPSPVG